MPGLNCGSNELSCAGDTTDCAVILNPGTKAASELEAESNRPAADTPAARISAKRGFIRPSHFSDPHPTRGYAYLAIQIEVRGYAHTFAAVSACADNEPNLTA